LFLEVGLFNALIRLLTISIAERFGPSAGCNREEREDKGKAEKYGAEKLNLQRALGRYFSARHFSALSGLHQFVA
jgi:hypothetical protein